MALKNNTWKLNQWYDQSVAGNVEYSGFNELFTWGSNYKGSLGVGDEVFRSSPVQVPGGLWNYLSASRGGNSYGTRTDGTLWVWGYNSNGELGLNNRTSYSSPKQVSGTTWEKISSYGESTNSASAIKTDGTLWSWGRTWYGVLGLNQSNPSLLYSSPVQVGTDTTWNTITNSTTTFATKTDGTLWAWGRNTHGQLLQNDNVHRSSPVQVGSDTNWGPVNMGTWQCMSIKTDGTLWSWGAGSQGNLGQNSPNTSALSSPVQVGNENTWSDISCGQYNSHGVKTDGTLWSWGYNNEGQLGLNDKTTRSSPTQVGSDTTWKHVETAKMTSHATKIDGTLWAWGGRDEGALGLGEYDKVSSPIQVGSNTGWDVQKSHNTDNQYVMYKFIK
tara:strand:+ start:171 stop:1331 length:1161 start_codon:yes stop_codon:yes gene_type:complete